MSQSSEGGREPAGERAPRQRPADTARSLRVSPPPRAAPRQPPALGGRGTPCPAGEERSGVPPLAYVCMCVYIYIYM